MRKSPVVRVGSNTTVIEAGYIEPNTVSNTQLGPGFYSLNKRSNVPFVGLIGSAGYRKTISWGEIAEVPEGQLVRISNASYHGGDIFINKGTDYCNRPSRISVPVPFKVVQADIGESTFDVLNMKYPCDTRSAKRAYLNVDAFVAQLTGLQVFIRGRRLNGSMNTLNSLQMFAMPFGPGVGFLGVLQVPVNTNLTYIPLGQGALMGDDTRPHMLLDAGDMFIVLGIPGNPLSDFITWPLTNGIVAGQNPDGPGMWYILEYD